MIVLPSLVVVATTFLVLALSSLAVFIGLTSDVRWSDILLPSPSSDLPLSFSTLDDHAARVMRDTTEFFGSQLGGQKVVNYSYTSSPWRLLAHDIYYFFAFCRQWAYIVWPVRPSDSGDLGELAPTAKNLFCLCVHGFLIFAQLGFLYSLLFSWLFPVWLVILWVLGFMSFNFFICGTFLNGKDIIYHSDVDVGPLHDDHKNEQWIYLNGVAAGSHWMMSNLNRLSLTFRRPIMGIHNRTHGVIFDTIECLIQRNFTYATSDVRMCYRELKRKLYEPDLNRVIFILHSQGGIEGGLVLDWLIQELPQDLLLKLEVYTFGCAANHFNNPHRHILSQRIAQANPAAITATTTTTTQVNTSSTTKDDITAAVSATAAGGAADSASGPAPPVAAATASIPRVDSLPSAGDIATFSRRSTGTTYAARYPPHLVTDTSSLSTTSTVSAAADRAIGHIEHYAHTTDFVARWGVLHFAGDLANEESGMPRYMGRVFSRTSSRGGHQMVQHYLDGMFPLERDDEGNILGALEGAKNGFMESEVRLHEDGEGRREGGEVSSAASASAVAVHGVWSRRGTGKGGVGGLGGAKGKKVRELSRLWGYVNGKVPVDIRF